MQTCNLNRFICPGIFPAITVFLHWLCFVNWEEFRHYVTHDLLDFMMYDIPDFHQAQMYLAVPNI